LRFSRRCRERSDGETPNMGFKCGIVGLPNVGKSTLFNALTNAGIAAANYPFCTIDPNVGTVPVPDLRLATLAEIANPQKVIPTTMEFVDIAGLVAGAAAGEGLGNQFLGHIREVDAIAHVVRCFQNDDITHVAGNIDPIADIEVIDTELALADLESCEKGISRLERVAKSGDKDSIAALSVLNLVREGLDQGQSVRSIGLSQEQRAAISEFSFLTAKPVMFVVNVDESGLLGNSLVDSVNQIAQAEDAQVVSVCAAIEAEIAELEVSEKDEFLADLGLSESGLDRVIRAGYTLLALQTFFTAGDKEVRAWTVQHGATAPQAAGRIHTDFERGFIRAEVTAFDDYVACGGEQGAKDAGKLRVEGKDYRMKEGDVVHFRFNI